MPFDWKAQNWTAGVDPDELEQQVLAMRAGLLSVEQMSETINAIATMAYTPYLADVETALDHPDFSVRWNALDALWFAFTSDRRLDRILEILRSDEDDEVRCSAALALAHIGQELNHPELIAVLENAACDPEQSDDVQDAVRRALQQWKQKRA